MTRTDSFSPYDTLLAGQAVTNPWNRPTEREVPRYQPDYDLLGRLLTVPVSAGAVSESGSFANGIDAWIAAELRRAGFLPDEVWPRPVRPRVLPRDVAVLLTKLPAAWAFLRSSWIAFIRSKDWATKAMEIAAEGRAAAERC